MLYDYKHISGMRVRWNGLKCCRTCSVAHERLDWIILMHFSEPDKLLLRAILQGWSMAEVAARLGVSVAWVEARSKVLAAAVTHDGMRRRVLPRVAHPRLRALLRLWDSRRGDRWLPAHGALRITDLQPWIEHTLVTEVEAVTARPRIRVMGRRPMHYLDGDLCGKDFLDHVPEDAQDLAWEPYRRCVRDGVPHYSVLCSTSPGWEHLRFHRLLLPHATNGHEVDIILVAAYLESAVVERAESVERAGCGGSGAKVVGPAWREEPKLPDGIYALRPRKSA